MSLTTAIIQNKWILLFYLLIASLIYINRKKFDIQGKIVFLYRTKFGLKFIDKIATKHKELVKIVGLIGIGAGFIGLLFISILLIQNLITLLLKPESQPGVSLIIPGVHIPGSPVFVPFWFGMIALFIVVVIHEFGHGVIARAHGLKIKSSGFGMFAIFPIAFVEPDEKKIRKQKDHVQYSIFAAGPFFNILLAAFAALLLFAIFLPAQDKLTDSIGFTIGSVQTGYPAEAAGIMNGTLILGVNGITTKTTAEFTEQMQTVKPGETITLETNQTNYSVKTIANPTNPKKAYLGIIGLTDENKFIGESATTKIAFDIFLWIKTLIQWIFVLSFGIGLANLLPLGPVDGGRMLQIALLNIYDDKNKADKRWKQISLLFLLILVINVLFPLLKALTIKMF